MSMIGQPQREEVATLDTDGPMHGNTWLQSNPHGGPLATSAEGTREWQFPNGDELFRGIYTRAGTGFAGEVLAVCSAIAGEGKTTVCVGLGVTLAQDFPDRRV